MNDRAPSTTLAELDAWWNYTPGARRFITTLGREVELNRATAIDLPLDDADGFISVFTQNIQRQNYSLVVERFNLRAEISSGDFLTDLAAHFDPSFIPDLLSGSIVSDIARREILRGYVVIVVARVPMPWLPDVIRDFNRVDAHDKGSIIFLTSELPPQFMLRLADFITPYDIQFFAFNLLESAPLSPTQKLYVATLTSKLAGSSALLTKNLSTPELYADGRRLAKEVLGAKYRVRLYERAVWETQIQFALPIVETVREKLIACNVVELRKLLPVTDEFGKQLVDPWDMELRHLHFYGGNMKVFSTADWETLELVYRARNDLSHLVLIDGERLDQIFSLADF